MDSIWYEVIVIILSIFLGLFLIVSIILVTRVIEILKTVKRITDHAEQVVDKAEHISTFFEKTATPVALIKLIANMSESFKKKGKRR